MNNEGNSRDIPEQFKPGLYIHIPFCEKKCPYCGFYSITDRSIRGAFVDAVCSEIRMIGKNSRPDDRPSEFDTIYLGGGTPSVLTPLQIEHILSTIMAHFRLSEHSEITIEVNPGTVTEDDLFAYREYGINRINIGVQSFSDKRLAFLGRIHTGEDAARTIVSARKAGFRNIGIDLMYALPGQSILDFESDLRRVLSFRPHHISCYMLTIDENTPLGAWRKDGKFKPVPDSIGAEMFKTASGFFQENGFVHYEISNFAREACYQSRHNAKYWFGDPYIGFGPAAHSFIDPERRWNHASVKRYIRDVSDGRSPVEGREILTMEQRMLETVFLELRTSRGIIFETFLDRFGVDFPERFAKKVRELEKNGLAHVSGHALVLTTKGFLFHDFVTQQLLLDVG